MKKTILTILAALAMATAWACTSAIVSGKLTASGRPLLWKHRDTGDQNNRIKRIEAHDGLMEFVGLFDARDKRDTAAWMGMNTAGFAIMNTASYNLNAAQLPDMDKEGVVMRAALERCVTVDDFERLLQAWPKPMGVEANFGVIDAQGNGAYFETGNYTYIKYDLADAPDGILVRTNYSFSGREDEGYGYIRYDNARQQLAPHIAARDITPALFTEELSRTYYHSLLGQDFSRSGKQWIVDQDFIPRRISTASIVVEGVMPGEDPSRYIMWVALGFPPCAEVMPVTTGDGGVPAVLQGTGKDNHAPQADIVNQRKAQVYGLRRGNGEHYVNLTKLYNANGDGWCQVLKKRSLDTYRRTYEARRK